MCPDTPVCLVGSSLACHAVCFPGKMRYHHPRIRWSAHPTGSQTDDSDNCSTMPLRFRPPAFFSRFHPRCRQPGGISVKTRSPSSSHRSTKCFYLRIMGCPHRIYAQFIFFKMSVSRFVWIPALHIDIWITLMAVQLRSLYFSFFFLLFK